MDQPTRQELFELYKISIDEYRFQVRLNWERTTYCIVFNSAMISVGTGLLKVEGSHTANLFVALIFFASFIAAGFSVLAVWKGHQYYHRTVLKKTLIEDQLGLLQPVSGSAATNLAVGTTGGQSDVVQILESPERWLSSKRIRWGSVTAALIVILTLLGILDLIGIVVSLALWRQVDPMFL